MKPLYVVEGKRIVGYNSEFVRQLKLLNLEIRQVSKKGFWVEPWFEIVELSTPTT